VDNFLLISSMSSRNSNARVGTTVGIVVEICCWAETMPMAAVDVVGITCWPKININFRMLSFSS
jgi:hypothetical protein